MSSNSPETHLLDRISSLRARAASFQRPDAIEPLEWEKTTGIALELLRVAGLRERGELPPAKFPWAYAGVDDAAAMVAHAGELLDALAAGRDPYAGLFAEPGHHTVDHALFHDGERFHCIYIRGRAGWHWPQSPCNDFGHATSEDLARWTPQAPVLRCPGKGWDSFQVWAPHVIRHEGEWWMFYTGVNEVACQAIGLARSRDLKSWERHPGNPVITPGPWCGMWGTGHWSDCRDPMVLKDDDGTFYCYYTCARRVPVAAPVEPGTPEYGNADRDKVGGPVESCLGVASSRDLINWKDEGFIRLEKSLHTPPESPFMVKRGGRYFLFYTDYKLGTTCVVSDHPTRGFEYLPGGRDVIVPGVSASEIIEHDGAWFISKIVHRPQAMHFLAVNKLEWDEDGLPREGEPMAPQATM